MLQYIAAINANKATREAREVGEREGMFPMSFVMQAMNDDICPFSTWLEKNS